MVFALAGEVLAMFGMLIIMLCLAALLLTPSTGSNAHARSASSFKERFLPQSCACVTLLVLSERKPQDDLEMPSACKNS